MAVAAEITVDRDFRIAPVPRRIFGSFVEHMGRCVYSGIYEPGHPLADEHGYRRDVLDLTKELGATVIRYPGGNFVSGYDWTDGIGPVDERPRRMDGAWHTIETNAFGLHEFVGWARAADVEIMEAINLGTKGVEEARALVEYANHPGGTYWSDLRRRNGAADPFGITLWCLGNEMDGPWQIGHKTAAEYGRLAQETAKAMRMIDPDIELVACGSSNAQMPTFGAWESTVLEHAYDEVDYVSLHVYYQEHDGDAASFLASSVDMDYFISSVVATADAVKARRKGTKQIDLSFDEWNVWYQRGRDTDDQPHQLSRHEWRTHPRLIEDEYNVTDAVVVGTLLHALLRHADRVKIANLAQLVNVIAPIRSEEGGPSWRQSIFWPFARTAALAAGEVMHTVVRSDRHPTDRFGDVDTVDTVVTYDEESGRLAVLLANRSLDEEARVSIDLRGFAVSGGEVSGEVLTVPDGGDRFAANTQDRPERVGLTPLTGTVDGARVSTTLPALSWGYLLLDVAAD